LTFFFVSSLPLDIVDGPDAWYIETEVGKCQRWWWSSLLLVQNYVNLDEKCLDHTWYLSADWQLFLITPAVVMLLKKFGGKFLAVMGVAVVALQCLTFNNLQK
jgi:peptidoglycan/LPS O-acetylase OafA/YrhL